jgi:phosphoglycerate dehydrogenase-like enzyme
LNRVAVLDDYQQVALQMADWSSLAGEAEVTSFSDHLDDLEQLSTRLAGYEIVVAMRERTAFPRRLFERLPQLRLLVATGRRHTVIDLQAAGEMGIVVCGTRGLESNTSELTWALILALLRRVPTEAHAMRRGGWQSTIGVDLAGRTLGILGLGSIGRRVARVATAFDMRVLAWSHNLTAAAATESGATWCDKDTLLADSDVITIHLVLSERTRGLVGSRELALMKPEAFLINTSRGPIVDEDALIGSLRGGRIAGAALDVFATEPLPPDHVLRTLPNALLTPHLGYVTENTYRNFYRDVVEDIGAYLAGSPIREVVESSR